MRVLGQAAGERQALLRALGNWRRKVHISSPRTRGVSRRQCTQFRPGFSFSSRRRASFRLLGQRPHRGPIEVHQLVRPPPMDLPGPLRVLEQGLPTPTRSKSPQLRRRRSSPREAGLEPSPSGGEATFAKTEKFDIWLDGCSRSVHAVQRR